MLQDPAQKLDILVKVGWGWTHPFRDLAGVDCGPWSVFVKQALLKYSHVNVSLSHVTMAELCVMVESM